MIDWKYDEGPLDYPSSIQWMEDRAFQIAQGQAPELIWGLQYPHLYTTGGRGSPQDLLSDGSIPIYETNRGGQYTYHGPGQLVVYVLLTLRERQRTPSGYILFLEQWIERTLKQIGIETIRHEEHRGVWVNHHQKLKKIASIGVRVSKGISSHGFALNVHPDLHYFQDIVPCGLNFKEFGVTSCQDLGAKIDCYDIWQLLKKTFFLF